ncbi:OmpW family protein [Aquimarina hainanensis]|uniref:OmpW family protein n=1 Tax=Aquimarina hainanensis TaxID=1578017 RepID=A0ABW5NB57_9FLAO
MKEVLVSLLVVVTFVFSGYSQEDKKEGLDYSKWQIRVRGVVVNPDESATIETIGGNVDISTSVIPEVDITYFFTKNIAAELILGTTKHNVEAISTAPGDIDLGHVWLLPPTLTLQYHFTELVVKPYVGAGVNYTIFYGVDEGDVANDVDYDNSFGFALQAGIDYDLTDKWFLNVDVKKIFLQTDVTVDATSALGATVGADVDINPWLFGLGVGYKF